MRFAKHLKCFHVKLSHSKTNITNYLFFPLQLAVEKITVNKHNGNAAVFYQNKEMQTLYSPFKIAYVNDTIDYIHFKASDALWSKNFKRAIASAFQLKALRNGAFVEEEVCILLSKHE